jgi:hypothetical protein
MTKRRAYLVVGLFAFVGFVGASLLVPPFLAVGVPLGYATVVGIGVATPALVLFGFSWTGTFDSDTYYESGTVVGDGLWTALAGVVVGSVGLTVGLLVAPESSWIRSLAVGCAILGGYAVFIRRNRDHFADDANPWVGGKLAEWLD